MIHSDPDSRMEFNFEGQFLGFVSHDGKLKYLRLQVRSEEMQIKIPKAVRMAIRLSFQPGELIRVTGIGKLDHGALKLKATQITPLIEHGSTLPASPSSPTSPVTQASKIKSKIKVLVCQKSGCLKKGGKELGEALDRILCERNLNQHVTIERTGCVKRCSAAPNLVIMPGNHRYVEVRPGMLPQIADAIAQRLTIC